MVFVVPIPNAVVAVQARFLHSLDPSKCEFSWPCVHRRACLWYESSILVSILSGNQLQTLWCLYSLFRPIVGNTQHLHCFPACSRRVPLAPSSQDGCTRKALWLPMLPPVPIDYSLVTVDGNIFICSIPDCRCVVVPIAKTLLGTQALVHPLFDPGPPRFDSGGKENTKGQ